MAIYYFRNAAANWGTATNWSTSSGGPANGAVPTNVDDAIFDANSGNCTVDTTARVARSVNFTAYTRTITMSNTITLGTAGGTNMALYLGSGMTIAGTAGINTVYATGILQSNGKVWPNNLGICNSGVGSNGRVVTIVDDWTINGVLFLGSGNFNFTLSGNGNFNCNSSVIINGGPQVSTSKTITMLGSGSLSGTQSTTSFLECNVTINSGVNTVTVGNLNIRSISFTYSSGTVNVVSGTTILTGNGTVTWNTNPMIFSNITLGDAVASTIINTINSNLNISGNLSTSATIRNVIINGSDVYLSGSCLFDTITSGQIGGTSTIRFRGAGLLSATGATSAGIFISPMTFESGVNTVTLRGNASGNINYNTGPITYTSGIVDSTTNSVTLNLNGATTLNTQGMNWYSISTSSNSTHILNSVLSATTLTISNTGSLTWSGSFGFNIGTFSWLASTTQTITLTQLVEYIIRTSMTTRGSAANLITLTSSNAVNRALLTLNNSAIQDVGFTSATRINSSSGQTIYTRRGALTDTVNWQLLTNPVTVSKSFLLQ